MDSRFRIPPGYWRRFAAGAAFGIFMSHLLYYLNPQIEISSTKLTLINLGYGFYCGVLFGTILWGMRLLRRRLMPPLEFKPHGFGIMTFATFVAAFVYWGHYLTLRIYLPVQAVRVLKRGTITIGVAAFLMFLLWLAERNAEKRVSQIIFGIGCTLLLYAGFQLHQNRESFLFAERARLTVSVASEQTLRPIVVVAIDSVAHDWLIELEPERRLPFFHDRDDAFFSRVEPFPTTSRRSIWASLTTGKLPYRHGITDQYSRTTPLNRDAPYLLLPNGVGFEIWGLVPPVRRQVAPLPSGHARAVWEIFDRVGREARVISWPGVEESVEAVSGNVSLDPARSEALGVYAPVVEQALSRDVARIDRAIEILEADPPDLMMLSLGGMEEIQGTARLDSNTIPAPVAAEGEAIRTWLEETGVALERLSEAVDGGVLFVISPSALHPHFAPDDLQAYVRSRLRPDAGDADGFVMVRGGPVHAGRSTGAASVTDLVPTLLFAAGLPVARDMDGRVLSEAFEGSFVSRTRLRLLPSWDVRELEVRQDEGR